MALKPDRNIIHDDVSFFCNEVTERGRVMIYDTSGVQGSGAAMDDALQFVVSTGAISGNRPAGILLNDVVNLDLTRQHINQHQDEVQLGGKVTLLKQGWIVTNATGAQQPTNAGEPAYYDVNGLFTTARTITSVNDTDDTNHVGHFMSVADSDGYLKVNVNIL